MTKIDFEIDGNNGESKIVLKLALTSDQTELGQAAQQMAR